MKTNNFTIVSLFFAMLFATGCGSPKSNKVESTVTEPNEVATRTMDASVDVPETYDFNGDGKVESLYLQEPQMNEEEMNCEGDCSCFIMFSDNNIPPIEVPDCIGGSPEIFGDLDGNGTCEIGIWPLWWTSCWHTYYIYTFDNGSWTFFVEPFTVHCNLMEELEETGEPIIEPVLGEKDLFMIKYSEFDLDKGILTKTATVKKLIGDR